MINISVQYKIYFLFLIFEAGIFISTVYQSKEYVLV